MSTEVRETRDVISSFSSSFALKQELRRAAADRGVSVSELVRQALRRELDQECPLDEECFSEEDAT